SMSVSRITAFGSPEIEREFTRPKRVTAASGGPYTSGMVALVPTEADAARLAYEGGLPAHELHTTALFLGEADQYDTDTQKSIVEAAAQGAANFSPIEADIFSVSMFNPTSEFACWVLGVGGEDVMNLRHAVNEPIWGLDLDDKIPEQHKPWVPHITITYSNDRTLIDDMVERIGSITFDRVRVAFAESEVSDIWL
ncbi:MAG TPA: 2'-5' RNA ligase family protein, partial [Gammaproteobacteria bacterium]|nr:2'-5' RNA ligase family protein [Gammaproteobacteria bacterium]